MVQEKVEMEEQQTSLEAELTIENIQGDRSEEDRLTEAEKNERQRKMLLVWYMNYANSVTCQASYIEFFLAPSQGVKRVLSGLPGQLDFLGGQIAFKAYLAKGRRSRQTKSLAK